MENTLEGNQTGLVLGAGTHERTHDQERVSYTQADAALRERVHALLQLNELDSKKNIDLAFAECRDIRDQLVNKLVKEKVTSENKGFLGAIKGKFQELAVQVGCYRAEKEKQLNNDNLISNQEMSLVIGNALKNNSKFDYKDGIRTRADLLGGDVRYEAFKDVNAATIQKYNDNLGIIDRYVPANQRELGRFLGVAAFATASILARREIYQGFSALAGDATMLSGAMVGGAVGGAAGYVLSKLKGKAYFTENYLKKLEGKVDLSVFSGNSTESKLRDLLNKAEAVRNGNAINDDYDSKLVNAYSIIDNMLGDWELKGDNAMKAKLTTLYADIKAYIIKNDLDVKALVQANLASDLKANIDGQYSRDAKIAAGMGLGFGVLGGGLFGYLNENHGLIGHAHAQTNDHANNVVVAANHQPNTGFYRPFDADFDHSRPEHGFGGLGQGQSGGGMGKIGVGVDPLSQSGERISNAGSSIIDTTKGMMDNTHGVDPISEAADKIHGAGSDIVNTSKDMMNDAKDLTHEATHNTAADVVEVTTNPASAPSNEIDWNDLPIKVDQRIMDQVNTVEEFENLKQAIAHDLAKEGINNDYLMGEENNFRIAHYAELFEDKGIYEYADRIGVSKEALESVYDKYPSLEGQSATGLEIKQVTDLIKLAGEGENGAKIANVIADEHNLQLGRFAGLIEHYQKGNISDSKLFEVTVNVLNSDKDIPSDVIVNIQNNPNIDINNSLESINDFAKGHGGLEDVTPASEDVITPLDGGDTPPITPDGGDGDPIPPYNPDGGDPVTSEGWDAGAKAEAGVATEQSKESWWGWLWNSDKPISDNAPLTNYLNYNEAVNTGLKVGGVYLAGRYVALPVLRGLWNAGAWVRNRFNRPTPPAGPAPVPPVVPPVVPGGPAPAPAAPGGGAPVPPVVPPVAPAAPVPPVVPPVAPVGGAAPVPPVVPPAGPAPTPPATPPGGPAPTPPPVPGGPAPTPPPVI